MGEYRYENYTVRSTLHCTVAQVDLNLESRITDDGKMKGGGREGITMSTGYGPTLDKK